MLSFKTTKRTRKGEDGAARLHLLAVVASAGILVSTAYAATCSFCSSISAVNYNGFPDGCCLTANLYPLGCHQIKWEPAQPGCATSDSSGVTCGANSSQPKVCGVKTFTYEPCSKQSPLCQGANRAKCDTASPTSTQQAYAAYQCFTVFAACDSPSSPNFWSAPAPLCPQ